MNILHLQNHFNISCGVSKTIYLIVKNTSSQFQHFLACYGGDGFSRFESININPVILKDYKNSPFGFVRHLIKLQRFCKENQIDIIHSHHRYFDLLAFLISKTNNIKTITSVQSKVSNQKLFSYKSDMLIACSNSIKEHLINNYKVNERRIEVIQNAVDPNEFILTKTKNEVVNELKIPNDKFIIGYFGRMDFKEKGIDVLLNAFLKLTAFNQNLFLLLVGNGKDQNSIKDFVKKNNLNTMLIDAQEDISKFYQIIDLYVLPSRIDPFPLTMLEAGLMKAPFIGSRVDGIAEMIEHEKNGLLFGSDNVDDLTEQILIIIRNKKLSDFLSESLNKKVLKLFTIDKFIPKYERVYSNVCK